jgi:hypothetical protein
MAAASIVAGPQVFTAPEQSTLTQFEHAVCDIELINAIHNCVLGWEESIKDLTWVLMGEANQVRFDRGEPLFINLDGYKGSSYKVIGDLIPVWAAGYTFFIYRHPTIDHVGVLVRQVPDGALVLIVNTDLISSHEFLVEYHNKDGRVVAELVFPTNAPWNVSHLIHRVKVHLFLNHLVSRFAKVELKFNIDDAPLKSAIRIWSPSWQVPKGVRVPPRRRLTIRQPPAIRTMNYYHLRRQVVADHRSDEADEMQD